MVGSSSNSGEIPLNQEQRQLMDGINAMMAERFQQSEARAAEAGEQIKIVFQDAFTQAESHVKHRIDALGVDLRTNIDTVNQKTEELNTTLGNHINEVAARNAATEQQTGEALNSLDTKIQQLAQGLNEGRTSWTQSATQLQEMQAEINRLSATAATTQHTPLGLGATGEGTTLATLTPYRRKPLDFPAKFDGKPADFPGWEAAMKHKLSIDEVFIGGPEQQFYTLYSRLDGIARDTIGVYYREALKNRNFDMGGFWAYLESNFGDPGREARAARALQTLKMRPNEGFAKFLAKFEKQLVESGGMAYPDQVKINMLDAALSQPLRQAMIPITDMPLEYTRWHRRVLDVATRLEAANQTRQWENQRRTQTSPRQSDNAARERRADADGDTPMVGANTVGKRGEDKGAERAKWTTQEERDRRREEGLCMRCGKTGHRAKTCRLRAAKRPDSAKVAAVHFEGEGSSSEASEN
jgi:hypothetical protein